MFTHKFASQTELINESRKLTKAEQAKLISELDKYLQTDVATYIVKGRSPKEGFFPKLDFLAMFADRMDNLSVHPFVWIEVPNPTPKKVKRLETVSDAVYKNQGLVYQKWREVLIDYQMAGNDVIFKEFMRDTGTFLAYFLEYYKRAKNDAKQHPDVNIWMDMLRGDLDLKQDWFKVVFEDLLTLAAGMSSPYSDIPCDVTELKTTFYDAMKAVKRDGFGGMR